MRGYWHRPDETANVMLPDGWLRTGDIGHIDEHGFVFIEDRKKDMIIVSGFKVYPNEVEDVVARIPACSRSRPWRSRTSIPARSSRCSWCRKDPTLTADALIEHCRKHLTGYKVPRRVVLPQRPAEDQRRQDPAPRAEGPVEGEVDATSGRGPSARRQPHGGLRRRHRRGPRGGCPRRSSSRRARCRPSSRSSPTCPSPGPCSAGRSARSGR